MYYDFFRPFLILTTNSVEDKYMHMFRKKICTYGEEQLMDPFATRLAHCG